jgi:hypothetical protein
LNNEETPKTEAGKTGPDCYTVRGPDLKPGMFVIVKSWREDALVDPAKQMQYMTVNELRTVMAGRRPVGDPIKVLFVALPFFTVEICCNGMRGVVDSRAVELMVVSEEYVKSLMPRYFEDGAGSSPLELLQTADAMVKRAFGELAAAEQKRMGYGQVFTGMPPASPRAGA